MIRARLDQPDGRVVLLLALSDEEIDRLRADDAPDVVSFAEFGLGVDVLLAGPAALEEYRKIPKFAFLGIGDPERLH